MRRGNGGGIRRTESGEIESANLGADYTAEHEWGIKDLARDFGLDPSAAPGVPRRIIRNVPQHGGLFIDETLNALAYVGRYNDSPDNRLSGHSATELGRISEGESLAGAWSDGDFAVRFPDTEQGRKDVLDLWEAFDRKDIAFLFANVGDNPFARAGLNLVIVSRLPQEIVDDLAEKDADNDRLLEAATATGIKPRIDAAVKAQGGSYRGLIGYYALSPRWATSIRSTADGALETKYPVIFWLNPTNQQDNKAGYFTVEQLDEWLAGNGPIVGKRVRA